MISLMDVTTSQIFLLIWYFGQIYTLSPFQDPEAEDMCQRLRVAIKVGTMDGQYFYCGEDIFQSEDAQEYTFVGIKGTRKNGADLAMFGNVLLVGKPRIFCTSVPNC